MAHQAPSTGEPAKQVAIDLLRQAGEPLHAKEIAERVLASGRCAGLKGRTPEATITAMLAVGSKPGGPFARVDKGTYTLADAPSAATQPAQPPRSAATKAPTQTREPAPAQKPKSAAAKRQSAKRSR
jgi:restriction system protein